jgi:hypothetical protein
MGNHAPGAITMPGSSATSLTNGASFVLQHNSASIAGDLNGYIFGIRATASTTGANAATSEPVYEMATRSVIMFSNITQARFWNDGGGNLNGQVPGGETLQLWLRGGDSYMGGSNSTAGFPLRWSDGDGEVGIRLMTRPGANTATNTGTWYWVSWEINVPAYFHFIAGSTTTAAEAANGPLRWSWGKNYWAFQYREFPLYPGGSLVFRRDTQVSNPATDAFEFYNVWSGSRQ